jgi:glyoxylase-like metal-dependent hydrolase (beta-lactamase superfamily II)
MGRFLRRLGIVVLIGLAGFGGCVYNRITNLGYDSITDDAFMIDGFGSNVGVLRTDAGTVLVDSMTFPMQGKRIRALAEELTGQPVRIVISTHYHLDHTHGNPAFDRETEFVSTARTLANLRARDGAFWDGANADKLPETTFDHEHEIKLGGKTIRLLHPGRGHTDGDLVVLFVEDRVLHTGDLFVHGMYPNIDLEGGGSIERWIETLDRVATLDFDSAIPGHGLLGDVKAIRDFQQYLRDLWSLGKSAAERGASLEQTLDSADLSAYSHLQTLSVPFVLRLDRDFNVTRAWQEATGNFTYVPAKTGG